MITMSKDCILKLNTRYSKLETFSNAMFDELQEIIYAPEDSDDFFSYLSEKPEQVTCSLQPTIMSITAMSSLGCKIDCGVFADVIPNSKSTSNQLIVKLLNPKATVTIFKSGKMTSFGAKSTQNCYLALLIVAKMIHNCGVQEVNFQNFQMSNICTMYNVCHDIDLVKMQRAFYTCSSYEPELDSWLSFYLSDPKTTARVSSNGKVVLLGNKSMDEAKLAFEKMYKYIHPYERVPVPLSCCPTENCLFTISLKRYDTVKVKNECKD